ncbi:UDP-glucose 4-epimerase [alpha proteobacterium U9-1i]|nr:UDP-glucose 4-epimerase [alpha proteobacterium U9-1i]
MALHRGQHQAELPPEVRVVRSAHAGIPVTRFPPETITFAPDVVLLTIAMGQSDASAAIAAFDGRAARVVLLSSGDVYAAYGRFTGFERGAILPTPLSETSPLRQTLFPYRTAATPPEAMEYWYEKILAEREVLSRSTLPGTVLRLPKVYGPEDNANLATIYGMHAYPHWKWTHGHVDNVAHAITLAVADPLAAGEIFNVGELNTPTMGERLALLPPRSPSASESAYNFAQDIAYDTSKIRRLLGYSDIADELHAMSALARSCSA